MNASSRHRVASAIIKVASRILPSSLRSWGQAMHHEIAAIEVAPDALRFSIGCLGFALRHAIVSYVVRPLCLPFSAGVGALYSWGNIAMKSELHLHPRLMVSISATAATSLGLVYMTSAGAPVRHLAMNASALILGLTLAGIMSLAPRSMRLREGIVALAVAAALLVTSLFGVTVNGATRWVSVGIAVQPSLILLPIIALSFARLRDGLSTIAVLIAALALAIQPDRAMASALAAAMAALMLVRPGRYVTIGLAASMAGFVTTMIRTDTQPAMPYVDQIFFSAFGVYPLAGLAIVLGAGLMIVPAIVGAIQDPARRECYAVFGAVWLAVIVAAVLGNYPTPLVGYGGSAILGYVLSQFGLPRHARSIATANQDDEAPSIGRDEAGTSLSYA